MIKPLIIKEKFIDEKHIETFRSDLASEGFSLTPFMVSMLLGRGVDSLEKAHRFLKPGLDTMYDPFLMKDMKKAVDLIKEHIQTGNSITVYGDYDVDGVTSTSILYMTLKECGAQVDYYIPDRIEEGYGINKDALTKIRSQGTKLVISVDTGITAVDQVDHGRGLGMDMIITDHHECQEVIPRANAVLNPKQDDCSYPYDMIAGVGVTYKLVQGLAKVFDLNQEFVLDLLEIVAVGTISDLVPLVDENRTFVYQAFKRMRTIKNLGLNALVRVSGIDTGKITAGSIGFQIGPRLNAAGRLGDAKRGVALFLSRDPDQAMKIAEDLNEENLKRRAMEDEILEMADRLVQENIDLAKTKVLVVGHEGWHHGVIGIVASRICEKYYRPTILLAIEDGVASGSARSVEGFSIFDALSSTKHLLDKFGGHEMAAGMSFDASRIEDLRENLNEFASKNMGPDTLIPKIRVESRMLPSQVNVEFIEDLSVLEPYGMGNEEPRFLIDAAVKTTSLMGKELNHFKMSVSDTRGAIDAVGFYAPEYYDELVEGMEINTIGTFNINEWKGFKKPQVFIKAISYQDKVQTAIDEGRSLSDLLFSKGSKVSGVDNIGLSDFDLDGDGSLRPVDQGLIGEVKTFIKDHSYLNIKIDRAVCATVYKNLRSRGSGSHEYGPVDLMGLCEISKGLDNGKSYEENMVSGLLCLKVFDELDLITCLLKQDKMLIGLNLGKKVELPKSTLYNSICC